METASYPHRLGSDKGKFCKAQRVSHTLHGLSTKNTPCTLCVHPIGWVCIQYVVVVVVVAVVAVVDLENLVTASHLTAVHPSTCSGTHVRVITLPAPGVCAPKPIVSCLHH